LTSEAKLDPHDPPIGKFPVSDPQHLLCLRLEDDSVL